MNGVISDHTLHISLAPSARIHLWLRPRVPFVVSDYVLGCLLWCHLQHDCAIQKASEEVVTDGYEGAIHCALWSEITPLYIFTILDDNRSQGIHSDIRKNRKS